MQFFKTPNYDFIRWRWHALALSALVIIAGFVFIATKGMPLGIDFSGGTIVIFDRVRENFRFMRRDSLEQVVNTSVNQTLGRTIITAGTTFLAVFALFLFGGDVLRGFAFTMLVGIVSGTYSTVFIASAIAIILSRRKQQAPRATTTAAPAAPAVARERSRKPGRKARAS